MKNKKTLKVLIPIVIVIIVAGMWFVKNRLEKVENASSTDNQNEQTNEISEELKGADFTLKVSEEIDFGELSEYGLPVIADYGSDDRKILKEIDFVYPLFFV